jgi:hypothetical protein
MEFVVRGGRAQEFGGVSAVFDGCDLGVQARPAGVVARLRAGLARESRMKPFFKRGEMAWSCERRGEDGRNGRGVATHNPCS